MKVEFAGAPSIFQPVWRTHIFLSRSVLTLYFSWHRPSPVFLANCFIMSMFVFLFCFLLPSDLYFWVSQPFQVHITPSCHPAHGAEYTTLFMSRTVSWDSHKSSTGLPRGGWCDPGNFSPRQIFSSHSLDTSLFTVLFFFFLFRLEILQESPLLIGFNSRWYKEL